MVGFFVLPRHAAGALGIEVSQLDLPRCSYGVDADALWHDPRFIEIRRERAAIAQQSSDRRHDVHIFINIDRKAAAIIRNHLKCARARDRRERERDLDREHEDSLPPNQRDLRRAYMRARRRKQRATRANAATPAPV